MVNGINGFIFGYHGGNGQQNLDAQNAYLNGRIQQLNYAWGSVSEFLRESRETPQGRAMRLVAEAKQRHPEWEVKRLAIPLE